MITPAALPAKDWHRLAGCDPHGLHVDRENAIDLLFGNVERRHVGVRDAGIVDHDVEPPEAVDGGFDHRAHVGSACDVGAMEDRAVRAEAVSDRLCHAPAASLVEVIDDDAGTFLGKPQGNTLAEAGARPGHDRHLVLQPHLILQVTIPPRQSCIDVS
jgi:hypothetical protein